MRSLCCQQGLTLPALLCSLDGHALPILELKGVSAVETIALQGRGLTHLSGIVIASCISSNSVLKSLK
eukprot:scaffold4650_cov158-Isochrysis_galbana.AAC.1